MRLGYQTIFSNKYVFYCSFNEAEAHAPRIPHSELQTVLNGLNASMRPRRMRLGYRILGRSANSRGKCFNEAEAHAPRIPEGYNVCGIG